MAAFVLAFWLKLRVIVALFGAALNVIPLVLIVAAGAGDGLDLHPTKG